MRLQTRLVKLNSYKPENKTENPAKERDFLFYTIKTSHVTVTHPISQHDHLHLRLQKNLRYLSSPNAVSLSRMDGQRFIFLTNILSILNQAYIEQGASTLIYKYKLLYSI